MLRLLCCFLFCILVSAEEVEDCQPSSQFVEDIPCIDNTLIAKEIPFCKEFVNYPIDSRLDYTALDSLAEQKLKRFNASLESTSEQCFKNRKVLTCALAFPKCSSDPYVAFPCYDVCFNYYDSCGAAKHNASCNTYPRTDCMSYNEFVPTTNHSGLLLPTLVVLFLFSLLLL